VSVEWSHVLHVAGMLDCGRLDLAGGSASPTCTFRQVVRLGWTPRRDRPDGLDQGGVGPRAATREAVAMERGETYGGERHEEAPGEAPQGEAPPEQAFQGDAPQGEAPWRPDTRSEGAQVIRLRPLRVLVVSAEEPFRAACTMLIGRRDCTVFSLPNAYGAGELIAHERLDVAVVDGAEQLRAIARDLAQVVPPIGVVSVGDAEDVGLPGGPLLARWTRFEELFEAIEQADRARARECAADGRWPAGARSRELD
jgi:hypothetical protein